MSDILATLQPETFVEFVRLFNPEEGRMGVAVTFIAVLELMREGLIQISQTEAYAPIHVRAADPQRAGSVIEGAAAEVAVEVTSEDAKLLEQSIDETADDEEPLE
jgi:segregation and condensation protein A